MQPASQRRPEPITDWSRVLRNGRTASPNYLPTHWVLKTWFEWNGQQRTLRSAGPRPHGPRPDGFGRINYSEELCGAEELGWWNVA
jgi:hypothetical protein